MKNTNKYKLNIKTMKKGLLTLLAASLVFVGCQNYDDQFDDLNAQISALKSQVDGLAALSGQVASLSSTISGLQAGVAKAGDLAGLEASLASLASEVDAIQADLATAATAADVTALQADLAAVQADLDELLSASNIYQGNVTIASVNDLDTFEDLGANINIINGNVDIDVTAAMTSATVQAVIDNIFTVNGNFAYTDVEGQASHTFNNLTSVQNLTLDHIDGAASFAALTTAEVISITESEGDHDSDAATGDAGMMTSLHMPLLSSATSIAVGAANTINLGDSGTSVNINSMDAFGTANALTIHTATGGTLTAAALTTPVDANGDHDFALTLQGMASFTNPAGVAGGTLAVSAVPSVTVTDFQGDVDINAGVTTLVASATGFLLDGAVDVITANLTGLAEDATDINYDATDVTAQGEGIPSVAIVADNADMTDLTVAGHVLDVTVTAAPALASITISATMDDLSVTGNVDLTSLDVSDASIHDIAFDNNDDIESLTFDNATNLAYTGEATADTGSALDVTNNADLSSLTVSLNSLDDLDVDVNASLATLDFSGVTAIGAGANVSITGNALDAASITETDNSANTGSIDDGSSGMSTLTGLMAALTAQTAAVANIDFDSAQTITAEAGEVNNGNDVNLTDGGGNITLLNVYTKGAGQDADSTTAVTEVQAFGMVATNNETIKFTLNGVSVDFGAMSGDKDADIATILASAAADTAAAAGATVNATRGYNNSSTVTMSVITAGYSAALYGERYTTSAALAAASTNTGGVYGIGTGDEWTLTIGSESLTVSLSADSVLASVLAKAFVDNWPVATSNYALSKGNANAVISIASSNTAQGAETYNKAITLELTAQSTATTETSAALDYIIGATRATNDNATVDAGILVTFTSLATGADDNTIVTLVDNGSTADDVKLTSTTAPDTVFAGVNGTTTAASSGVTADLSGWL
ncbi:hypothetical protein N9U80_01245 [Flavobacteriaceae bacterium]|nr:hypothetical protein [Flavobacteriaceae bacterium]